MNKTKIMWMSIKSGVEELRLNDAVKEVVDNIKYLELIINFK